MESDIKITLNEYNKLLRAANFLDCLEACGVDNWSGYSDAIEMLEDEYDEQD